MNNIKNLNPKTNWIFTSYNAEHTGFMSVTPGVTIFEPEDVPELIIKNTLIDFESALEIYSIPKGETNAYILIHCFTQLFLELNETLDWAIENDHIGDDEFYDYFPDGTTTLIQLKAAIEHEEDPIDQLDKDFEDFLTKVRNYDEELFEECGLDNYKDIQTAFLKANQAID